MRSGLPQTLDNSIRPVGPRLACRFLTRGVVMFAIVVSSVGGSAQDSTMRMRLKDGSFGTGTLVGVDQAGYLGWQCDPFETAFQFDVRALRAVTRVLESQRPETSDEEPPPNEPLADADYQFFEMSNGNRLAGKLVELGNERIIVDSALLGRVGIERKLVNSIVDADYAGQIIYSGPVDDERWERLSAPEDWEFEAGALVATRPAATIVGNVELPPKSQISLVLSWKGLPDFVLSLGTLTSNKVSKVEEVPSAGKIEVWANQLALVREVDGGADVAMLSELTEINPRIELSIYLDQEAGTIVVCDAHGRPLETLKVPSKNPIIRPSVHLANNGPSLTIERFEVRQWDGATATLITPDERSVLDASGNRLAGVISGFDAASGQLQLRLASGELSHLNLTALQRGDLAPAEDPDAKLEPVDSDPPNIATDTGLTNVEQPQTAADATLELVLMDRTRLSGQWLAASLPDQLQFKVTSLDQVVSVPVSAIRGIIGNAHRFVATETDQVVGTLKSDQQQLTGYLDESPGDQAGSSTQLRWHPLGSSNASAIRATASGAIVYRKPLPAAPVVEPARQAVVNRNQPGGPAIGIFLGNRGLPAGAQAAHEEKAKDPTSSDAREIAFRTGDAIDGIVEKIDEHGITFRSLQTTTRFAPHAMIQHVWLNKPSGSTDISPEKFKRLMTVPRAMKQDPPSQIFIGVNGDYLRGRLVSLENNQLTIEVRLEQVEMSTSQIAQIVWLHDRDWDQPAVATGNDEVPTTQPVTPATTEALLEAAENPEPSDSSAAAERPFLVHAIARTDRGLTFHPTRLRDGVLHGESQLLGNCAVAINDLSQLLFGRDISQQVRAFRQDPWTLSLAQLPRVYLEDGTDGATVSGTNSAMVGQPAADFALKSLAGDSFRLSKHRDRIVVLDFWASWCGPCMQTMPKVDEVVAELGNERIHLVAINIQESANRAQAASERLKLTATVLLDSDGQTAAAYMANAIPQTVIIDRSGLVTHVFVGGGPKFAEQFRAALESVLATGSK